jgi:hypothetical protein
MRSKSALNFQTYKFNESPRELCPPKKKKKNRRRVAFPVGAPGPPRFLRIFSQCPAPPVDPVVDTMVELTKNKADLEKGYRIYIVPSAVTIANSGGPSVYSYNILNATLIKSERTLPIDQVHVCSIFLFHYSDGS